MIAAVVQFIKEQKHFILAFLISLTVISFGYYMNTLQTANHSLKVHLRSAENEIQQLIDKETQLTNSFKEQLQFLEGTLLAEKEEFEKKISVLNAKLNSSEGNMQRLRNERQEFQKIIDQNNADLNFFRSKNQELLEAKNEVLEKINQIKDDREVYSTQLLFIEKWIDCIDKLQEHAHAMVHCSESKRKRSSYADPKLCSKIGYDFDESHAGELILRAVDLIMKYKVECRIFLDALLLKKVEEMKKQQNKHDMKKIKERMEKLIEEVKDIKYQKRKEENVVPKHQQSKETAVERDSGILSTVWNFASWVGGMIVGLFWS